jgi:hypothetical protein
VVSTSPLSALVASAASGIAADGSPASAVMPPVESGPASFCEASARPDPLPEHADKRTTIERMDSLRIEKRGTLGLIEVGSWGC